jgi:large subunit ribosomal protein L9
MEVFLHKSVTKIGLAGEIITVGDGFARNYLIPQGLASEITPHNKKHYQDRIRTVEHRKEVIATEASMLADKISNLAFTFKCKMHDDGKLYGSLNASEIVNALAEKGISISKSQVEFDKAIKAKGTYSVTIKLTSRLKTSLSVTIVPAAPTN